MKRVFKVFAVIALLLMIAAVSGGFSLWHEISSHPDVHVSVNGADVLFDNLDLGDVIGASVGLAIAALVLLVVVPLVLLLGIGLPLLIVAGVLILVVFALLSVGAVVFSPLLLLAFLLWLALRSKPAPKPVAPAPVEPMMTSRSESAAG